MKAAIIKTAMGYKGVAETDAEGRVLLIARIRPAASVAEGKVRLSVHTTWNAGNAPILCLAIEHVPEDMPKDKMQDRLRIMCALAATRNNVDYVIMWEGE